MQRLARLIPKPARMFIRRTFPWLVPFLRNRIAAHRGLIINIKRAVIWVRKVARVTIRLGSVTIFQPLYKVVQRPLGSIQQKFGVTPRLKHNDPTSVLNYSPGLPVNNRIAWIVSFTGVSNEPRVVRQSQALMEAGWTVVVVGYQGHTETNPDWHFVEMTSSYPYSVDDIYYHEFWRKVTKFLCSLPFGKHWRMFMARTQHANILLWRYHTETVRDFAKSHPELKADLVLAHDFHSCEVAFAVRDVFKAKISVDCHEYARGQLAHDPVWIKYSRPYVIGMHEYFLPRADSVTTVSQGIADLMNKEEQLKKPVQLIRSMPFYRSFELREPGERITVLYHGDVSHVRGLHMAIESMPLWREEFDLLIRGSGDLAYISALREQAENLGVSHRVLFESPVPFDQIIPRANEADIGYFVHYDASPQKRFVLPNKFFEYVGAGLALCVSDLPEMARLVRQYDIGHLVEDYDAKKIADQINAFTRENIMTFKQNALSAAKELNWDKEKKKMLANYDSLL